MINEKKNLISELSDVYIFVAWVNTLCSDGSNLYRLAKIYARDRNEILQNEEVQRNLEYVKKAKP